MESWSLICRTKNKSGFTLVETLVAVTIFGIIATGIAASFVSGVKLWNRAKNIDFSRTELLLDLEKISRELRQSVYVEIIGFEGTAEEVSFPTIVNNSVVKVIYKFDSQQKALLRGEVKLADVVSQGEGQEELPEAYTEKTALSSLDELSFSYFEMGEESHAWSSAWTKDKGVFPAVKLHGRFKGEEFVKTIFIPAS